MKAQDPHKTIELNVRAILAVMRASGLEIENFQTPSQSDSEKEILDSILSEDGVEARFVRLPLS